MLAVSGKVAPPILVVAVIAHAHRIDREVKVLAVRDLAFLPAGFASFHAARLRTAVRLWANSCVY